MTGQIHITAFYKFAPIKEEQLHTIQKNLEDFGKKNAMRGLVLLAEEGINGTVCGAPKVIAQWKALLSELFGAIEFKDAEAQTNVFPRFFVKIREEIVTMKDPSIEPRREHNHVTPEEWDKMMEEDVFVLDARNDYETEIGVFESAIDPKLKDFQDFPKYVEKLDVPKDKKILLYCTGGIRCEKALIIMEQQGFNNVYQLKGGILAYLKKFPHKKFNGECFVFDHRVSVDQELKPSERYKLCPHCGDPGDYAMRCHYCSKQGTICTRCNDKESLPSCSKNCRYHLELLAQ